MAIKNNIYIKCLAPKTCSINSDCITPFRSEPSVLGRSPCGEGANAQSWRAPRARGQATQALRDATPIPGGKAKLGGPRLPEVTPRGNQRPSRGGPERGAHSMAEAEGISPLLLPRQPPPPGMAEVEAPTAAETDQKQSSGSGGGAMDVERSRFPYCVVWTPIPVLTHMQHFAASEFCFLPVGTLFFHR
ncbi:transmembrane protein 222 isoform X4 [Myotis myotis]|uniref:transmembrane protein 222 isoform X4 n=1 Tax=Myotis myotis TaxID=51298 RepID=UPI00174B1114|nr:transmembrane protein 222 isoform X4 [Myotis myotis]